MIIKKAEYVKDYKIKLLFSDGVTKIVDFKPFLTRSREIIAPLLDKEYFKSFYVDEITICWPNGLDFAPELLHEIGEETKERKKSIKPSVRRNTQIVQSRITCKPSAMVKKRPKKV